MFSDCLYGINDIFENRNSENKYCHDSNAILKDLPPALSSTPTNSLANAQPSPTRWLW